VCRKVWEKRKQTRHWESEVGDACPNPSAVLTAGLNFFACFEHTIQTCFRGLYTCFSIGVGALHVIQRFHVQRNLRLDIFFWQRSQSTNLKNIPIFGNHPLYGINHPNCEIY